MNEKNKDRPGIWIVITLIALMGILFYTSGYPGIQTNCEDMVDLLQDNCEPALEEPYVIWK